MAVSYSYLWLCFVAEVLVAWRGVIRGRMWLLLLLVPELELRSQEP